MSGNGKLPDMLGALRNSADGALKRLSRGSEPPPAPQPIARLDPTRAFMPGDNDGEDHESAMPLPALLEESAHAMVRRKEDLAALAGGLARRIGERREGEITMAAQAVRVVIGLAWLGAAVWLYNAILVARADGLPAIPGGAPLADAAVLMRTFFTVAAAGLGAAFGVAAIARAFGNADNGRVVREAEKLGGAIAAAAGEFDRTLTALRSAMDRRGRPADAVDDLSRAHLTALEAHAFFREVGFLTGAEDEHSARQFRGFLARAGGGGSDDGAFAALMSFLSGGVAGAFAVYVLMVPKPEISGAAPAALAIMQYPWAAQLLIFGGGALCRRRIRAVAGFQPAHRRRRGESAGRGAGCAEERLRRRKRHGPCRCDAAHQGRRRRLSGAHRRPRGRLARDRGAHGFPAYWGRTGESRRRFFRR